MRIKSLVTAGVSVALVASAGISGSAGFTARAPGTPVIGGPARLTDLAATPDPLDNASAHFVAIAMPNGKTHAILVVTGIARSAVAMTFGAHVHIGPCVAGDGAAALGHYNTGGPPSPTTEVWLDFLVRPGGSGVGQTTVPFVIPAGAAQSVVIHAMATSPSGAAGTRLACLPVAF